MSWSLDARTPVRLLSAEAAPGGAVILAEDGAALPAAPARVERYAAPPLTQGPHPAFCGCCQPRNPVSIALDRLFLARAKGGSPWFSEVVAIAASEAGRVALEAALSDDSVTVARFRKA
jgi:hypothetical protein